MKCARCGKPLTKAAASPIARAHSEARVLVAACS